jgi:hypothetical protein
LATRAAAGTTLAGAGGLMLLDSNILIYAAQPAHHALRE